MSSHKHKQVLKKEREKQIKKQLRFRVQQFVITNTNENTFNYTIRKIEKV
jgi:hypothetical protein